MFSGLVPWLSDHSINAKDALAIEADPSKKLLQRLLQRSLEQSAAAVVLAEPEYFKSKWTLMEFQSIVSLGIPCVLFSLDPEFDATAHVGQLQGLLGVYTKVEDVVGKLAERLGTKPVTFGDNFWLDMVHLPILASSVRGRTLSFATSVLFSPPGWFEQDTGVPLTWRGKWGEVLTLRFSESLVGNEQLVRGILGSREAPSAETDSRLHDLIEACLWDHVRRLSVVPGCDRLVGYHKIKSESSRVTALAISAQSTKSIGFYRYAVVISDHPTIPKIEMLCYVPGALQRFYTLLPGIDRAVMSLTNPLEEPNEDPFENGVTQHLLSTIDGFRRAARDQDFVWCHCSNCKQKLDRGQIQLGTCENCGHHEAECMTPHCSERKRVKISSLRAEFERLQNRNMPTTFEHSTTCECCLSNLFLPGAQLAAYLVDPKLGLPTMPDPRNTLLVIWMLMLMWGLYRGTGSIMAWAVGALVFFILAEPILSLKLKDFPVDRKYLKAHAFLVLPAIATRNGLASESARSLTVAVLMLMCFFYIRAFAMPVRMWQSAMFTACRVGILIGVLSGLWALTMNAPESASARVSSGALCAGGVTLAFVSVFTHRLSKTTTKDFWDRRS